MPGILGKKLGMTRLFDDKGNTVPLTLVLCKPNTVTQVKSIEKDGYQALVLGFEALKKPKKTRKYKFLRELRLDKNAEAKETEAKVGDSITVEAFGDVKEVSVTGVSKGKGFQGTVKRHNFTRGNMSHGSHHHREPGSVGPRARMGKLHKGKRLAGRMGGDTVTLNYVPLVKIDAENHLLAIKGSIPGPNGALVFIRG